MAGKRDEVTIAEVAEALNISKTTVSRAISGKGRVSEATRARVFDYIGKGRQDAAAPLRTAQQGPTNNLALVIPKHFMRLDLPFLRKCMGGVWNMAASAGMTCCCAMREKPMLASWNASWNPTRWMA